MATGLLWDLHKRCQEAKAFRHNCLELDAHARNILRVFDEEGALFPLDFQHEIHALPHACLLRTALSPP